MEAINYFKHIGSINNQRKDEQEYLQGPQPPQASTPYWLTLNANTKMRNLVKESILPKPQVAWNAEINNKAVC